MNNKYISLLLVPVLVVLHIHCTSEKGPLIVPPNDVHLQTAGRIAIPDSGAAEIYWPGSSFKIKFRDTLIKAVLQDERGFNYFNVIIDDSLVKAIRIDTAKTTYVLASGLPDTEHTVEISKRADWYRGKTWFYGFELSPAAQLLTMPAKKRRIEFYGNSITVGAAVEDFTGDNGDSTYTNNYKSYASITARHYDADYTCIAVSGIGLLVSWGSLIMPEAYNRLNPEDAASTWDFSKTTPDIVVVNLFQNDYGLVGMPDHEEFKRRFGAQAPTATEIITAYSRFIGLLRSHYPQAHIICTLGSMSAVRPGSPFPGYIEKAVAALQDKKIYTHFFAPVSSNKHPKVAEQQQMAESLEQFIDSHITW